TYSTGQSCTAGKRFVVHADIYDEFTAAFVEQMASLKVGDPLDPQTQVGPLATRDGRDDLAELVDDAVHKGAEVLIGGYIPEGAGYFYTPTVLAGLTEDMRLVQEEAFGPVATVYKVHSAEEALEIANQTDFGLSSAVWTTNVEEQEWFLHNVEAGA